MKNAVAFIPLFLLLLVTTAHAQFNHPPQIFEEQDGDPSNFFSVIKVTNGTLTDNGDGTGSIATGGGGGGGSGNSFPQIFEYDETLKLAEILTPSSNLSVDNDLTVVRAIYTESIYSTNSNATISGNNTTWVEFLYGGTWTEANIPNGSPTDPIRS